MYKNLNVDKVPLLQNRDLSFEKGVLYLVSATLQTTALVFLTSAFSRLNFTLMTYSRSTLMQSLSNGERPSSRALAVMGSLAPFVLAGQTLLICSIVEAAKKSLTHFSAMQTIKGNDLSGKVKRVS